MKRNNRLIAAISELALGLTLIGVHATGLIDEFWSSLGFAMIIIGIGNVIRFLKYRSDAEYREKVDISNQDERLKFLSQKAWSWAGYLFVTINGTAAIILKIMGCGEMSLWAAYNVCLVLILYWPCYLWLSKKY